MDYVFMKFKEYLRDNYNELERELIWNTFIQSGEYPDSFVDYIRGECDNYF